MGRDGEIAAGVEVEQHVAVAERGLQQRVGQLEAVMPLRIAGENPVEIVAVLRSQTVVASEPERVR